MKIAVFGGSFNPVHVGHAMLADTVIKELHYDKVLFVPTFIPPHKEIVTKITPEARFSMLQAFCSSESGNFFEAEPCEMERKGVSYTCDTLQYLTEKYKSHLDGKLAFIMGDEVAAEFNKWKNPEKIVELADLIITHRYPDVKKEDAAETEKSEKIKKSHFANIPTGSYEGDFKVKFDLKKFGYPCTYLKNPVLPVSSSDIRERIADGRSFKYLVPPAVYDYIVENHLYFS